MPITGLTVVIQQKNLQHTLEYIHEHMTFENYKELLETAKVVIS